MFKKEMTYGYGDICIIDSNVSDVEHRKECNTRKDGMLPIFAAPMSTVVNEKNYSIFQENGIIPIIPRNIEMKVRNKLMNKGIWVSYSLSEFMSFVNENKTVKEGTKVCIDLAKGNMRSVFNIAKSAKEKFGNNITLMCGNTCNPETYKEYCRAGIDYIRANIGGGSACISATQLGVHMGIATLIDEMYKLKNEVQKEFTNPNTSYRCITKIIADGGIRNYDDVIKALALGADYVMIGGLFAGLVESCAPTFFYDKENNIHNVDPLDANTKIRENGGIFDIIKFDDNNNEIEYALIDCLKKNFYGMASKQGQMDLFGKKKRTAEGKQLILNCSTNIDKWSENMSDFIASAMSYCDITDINDFNQENVETRLLSQREQAAINK